MKKNYIKLSVFVVALGMFSFKKESLTSIEKYVQNHKFYPDGNKIVGNVAGAPNEFNCTACHTGNTQSGSGINVLTLNDGAVEKTTYLTNKEYIIKLSMTNNPVKKGFEAVAMNSSNVVVGTVSLLNDGLVGITGSNINHPHHTTASSTNSTSVWSWKWKSPQTVVGNITFYVGSLAGNNDASSNNDIVYLSQHVFAADPSAGISTIEKIDKYEFSAGYSKSNNTVHMNFNSLIEGEMFFNLVDLSGKSVYTNKMGKSNIGENEVQVKIPNDLNEGIYAVNMFVHNNAMQKKIMIQK